MYSYWTTLTRIHLIHDAWHLGTPSGIAMAMVAGAVLALVFEMITLIHYRVINRLREVENSFPQSTRCNPSILPRRFIGTILYTLRVTVAYFLMLCVMSMNVWILISVLAGSGIGFFLLCLFKKKVPSNQSVEVKNSSVQNGERPNCRKTSNPSELLLISNGPCGGSKTKKTETFL